jgi:hypothetical protein
MKKMIVGLVLASLLIVPAIAQADGEGSYWEGLFWNSTATEKGNFEVVSQDDRLQYTADIPEYAGPSNDSATYRAVKAVDFAGDFEYYVEYNLSPDTAHSEMGLTFGLMSDSSKTFAKMYSQNGVDRKYRTFNGSFSDPTDRTYLKGSLDLKYTAGTNLLEITLFDGENVTVGTTTSFENFYNQNMGGTYNVFLNGYSGGDDVSNGEAYFKLFEDRTPEGPVAPEPVSSALFLIGGGALAFMRRKK